VLASAAILAGSAQAAFSGYLEMPEIRGETLSASGGSQTQTIGANSTETIKGGKAVVIGALWNGSDNPPKRNARGTADITLKRGLLSDSLLRLQQQKRQIPSMTLSLVGEDGKQTAYELENVLITNYSIGAGASDGGRDEIQLVYQKITW
jgi:type VI protein secretion system component Hcp